MLDQLPDLKSAELSESITIKIDKELKEQLLTLKRVHKKDYSEWIRRLLRTEFEKMKSS